MSISKRAQVALVITCLMVPFGARALAGDARSSTVLDGGTVAAGPTLGYATEGTGLLPNLSLGRDYTPVVSAPAPVEAPRPVVPAYVEVSAGRLEAPIAEPFDGAVLSAGLHTEDSQAYPQGRRTTSAGLHLTYQF